VVQGGLDVERLGGLDEGLAFERVSKRVDRVRREFGDVCECAVISVVGFERRLGTSLTYMATALSIERARSRSYFRRSVRRHDYTRTVDFTDSDLVPRT